MQRTVKSAVSLRYTLLLTAVDVKRYIKKTRIENLHHRTEGDRTS